MAKTTTYGVFVVYKGVAGELTVKPPAPFASAEKALAAAKTFALLLGGAVAYSKAVDDETGASEDGVIIGRFGVMAERPSRDAAA